MVGQFDLVGDDAVHAPAHHDPHLDRVVDGPRMDFHAASVAAPDHRHCGGAGGKGEKVHFETSEVADGDGVEQAVGPVGPQGCGLAHAVVVERHDDYVVDHSGLLDQIDDFLLEAHVVPVVLELDEDPRLALGKLEDLAQGRHALVGKLGCEGAADVEFGKILLGGLPHLELGACRAHEITIVLDHYRAVSVFLDVEFEPVGAVGDAAFECGHGVFGGHRCTAAMSDDLCRVLPAGIVRKQENADHGDHRDRDSRREDDLAGCPERCLVTQ